MASGESLNFTGLSFLMCMSRGVSWHWIDFCTVPELHPRSSLTCCVTWAQDFTPVPSPQSLSGDSSHTGSCNCCKDEKRRRVHAGAVSETNAMEKRGVYKAYSLAPLFCDLLGFFQNDMLTLTTEKTNQSFIELGCGPCHMWDQSANCLAPRSPHPTGKEHDLFPGRLVLYFSFLIYDLLLNGYIWRFVEQCLHF